MPRSQSAPTDGADRAPHPGQEDLGLKLRAIRADRGLTLAQVAAHCGVTEGYVSHVERGIRLPNLTLLTALAETYGMLVTEILDAVYPFGSRRPPSGRATRRTRGRTP